MLKSMLVLVFITVILVPNTLSRTVDTDEDDSIEIPIRKPNKSSNNGFSFLRPADDALFNFINKLVNTSYLSSRMMLNRVKAQSELRKQIEDQVEEFLENLPNVPIPVLEDFAPVESNINVKENV